jgi:two-component system, chemotaxis family, chemotaxis protein CheY
MTKVLLAEDELFVRELYQRVLTQSGFEVLAASDGVEAIEKVYLNPDIILLDIMMPRMTGLEALKKIKEDSTISNIPVILLTNLGQENIIKEAMRLGASGYLMKMRVTPYEIVDYVKEFLQNPTLKMDSGQMDLE